MLVPAQQWRGELEAVKILDKASQQIVIESSSADRKSVV